MDFRSILRRTSSYRLICPGKIFTGKVRFDNLTNKNEEILTSLGKEKQGNKTIRSI